MNPKQKTTPSEFAFHAVAVPQGDGSVLIKPGKLINELTPAQAAKIVGCHRNNIYVYLDRGLLPCRRPASRKILIPADAVHDLVEKSKDPEFWKNLKSLLGKKGNR